MGLNSLLGGFVTVEDLRGRFGQVGCDALSREVLLSSRSGAVGVAVGGGRGGWRAVSWSLSASYT
jgi:hypothetical protein